MSLETLFSRYGSRSAEADIKINGYLVRADHLETAARIRQMDQSAERLIGELEGMAADIRAYRKTLAARYAAIDTMPYRLRLELERRREGYRPSRVWYYVRIRRTYEDGTEVTEMEERHPGTERGKAFARYAALQKERPGIELWQSTEKGAWER